ncbi:MAG: bifunctional diaminohydroxyphosphoribosylaminopyrimidine deaminase/5-amino-6-(5-phosphoribosylamino)uracil reductase RibD [Candidatus Eisenbacteria bacterium]|uniref:Riboflavin biosynthesis protein RibD n=1 Tax=Eiseniibacteriota bacterium TaxID=2212470 RepID=A0A538U1G7_UNCEI|nr:MAG: bifunctional diaminohydroxyphosphoribosylaminopyrimidine deaminase/5-amino-6-(5-phosphoribosylamino)uracil reductase RibD [Candidatus Eisenbacteria bacterium]
MDEVSFMRRALRVAERGRGRVSPNPMVGALVVKGGRVVGEGWHRALGAPHAEAMALEQAGSRARGATLYVTLEPCAHVGRTPPCVSAILDAGVRRCVVATRDPHPIVDGRGLRRLRAAGIEVEVGLLAADARALLGGYWRLHTQGRPRVTLKLATSLDGRLAPPRGFAPRGAGRWLSGVEARHAVHRLRAQADAIVIGAGTARLDDPRLTVRGIPGARQPLRVVCDTRLSLPSTLRLLRAPLARGTVFACADRAPRARERALIDLGVRVWRLPRAAGGVSLAALMRRLGREGAQEVLVEGGARLATSLLRARAVDRLALFLAPSVLGSEGLAWCGPLARPARGRLLEQRRIGEDAWITIDMED